MFDFDDTVKKMEQINKFVSKDQFKSQQIELNKL